MTTIVLVSFALDRVSKDEKNPQFISGLFIKMMSDTRLNRAATIL